MFLRASFSIWLAASSAAVFLSVSQMSYLQGLAKMGKAFEPMSVWMTSCRLASIHDWPWMNVSGVLRSNLRFSVNLT